MKILQKCLIALAILSTGCGTTTKLINNWSDTENTPKSYEKLGVAVLFHDNSKRYITERAITDRLKESGVNAVPTYDLFPFAGRMGEIAKAKGDNSPEAIRNTIKQKVTENNFDGIMIVALFDKLKQQRWESDPGFYITATPYIDSPGFLPGSYYDYYYFSMTDFYNEGRYVDMVTYFLECRLYDVKTGKLFWRARTKTKDIKSVDDETNKLGEIITEQLKKQNILK
ncbi:MAG: hypothetical protein ACK5M7_14230 [Draconibacterium sp.]